MELRLEKRLGGERGRDKEGKVKVSKLRRTLHGWQIGKVYDQ